MTLTSMIAENISGEFKCQDFVASKQISLFEELKQQRFSGQLVLRNSLYEWTFFLYLGRLVYATGGSHPVRRWRRNLAAHLSQIAKNSVTLQQDLGAIAIKEQDHSWEYELLRLWIEQQKVSREQVIAMIRANLVEIFFDLTQTGAITGQLQPEQSISKPLVVISAESVIVEAWKLWQAWVAANLAQESPNMTLILKQPEQLKAQTSEPTYQALLKYLDGKHSLRDFAVRMRRDLVQVTRPLMHYVRSGLVELGEIADLPSPVIPLEPQTKTVKKAKPKLIACIDDSLAVCCYLETLLTAAGYKFLSINDPTEAIAVLLPRQPDVILLDLVMPKLGGYEICSRLRKVPIFRHTPIIILTGNDGIVDRVRAKVVGATDFINKPVNDQQLLKTIAEHLHNFEQA